MIMSVFIFSFERTCLIPGRYFSKDKYLDFYSRGKNSAHKRGAMSPFMSADTFFQIICDPQIMTNSLIRLIKMYEIDYVHYLSFKYGLGDRI